ncbi:MAG: triose-phosphate isomerase [Ruminococcus sp.]|nr:triose-phosphate isomerase [Ruminococcus sp.]
MNKDLRNVVIAGNWKMNKTRPEAKALIEELKPIAAKATCDVVICVPFTNLETAIDATKGTNIKVGAQNCHFEKSGAFTGEVSADMLAEMGVEYVVLGHSERRQYFGETDVTVNKRVKAALAAGLKVILCVGELLEQREQGITEEIVGMQTKVALMDVTDDELKNVIIAYEPVWAIGTGKTATAAQANEVCKYIRSVIADTYSMADAVELVIQYGGSMNAKNAEELINQPDVDGGLIGGASLKAADFGVILEAGSNSIA